MTQSTTRPTTTKPGAGGRAVATAAAAVSAVAPATAIGRIVRANLPTAELYEDAVRAGEGLIAADGPLVVRTGKHTGRSPKDKFVVREPGSEERIWWGSVNQPLAEDRFDGLRAKVVSYLEQRDLYVVNAFAGADPAHRLVVRVVTASPWHAI